MNAHCETYEEARELMHKGELQTWDGLNWRDVSPGQLVFFSRNVEDYRRKPSAWDRIPKYFVHTRPAVRGKAVHTFGDAQAVACFLWGLDLRGINVFKRVSLRSLDIKKIEEQLENI